MEWSVEPRKDLRIAGVPARRDRTWFWSSYPWYTSQNVISFRSVLVLSPILHLEFWNDL